jgi:hypothetical protein
VSSARNSKGHVNHLPQRSHPHLSSSLLHLHLRPPHLHLHLPQFLVLPLSRPLPQLQLVLQQLHPLMLVPLDKVSLMLNSQSSKL